MPLSRDDKISLARVLDSHARYEGVGIASVEDNKLHIFREPSKDNSGISFVVLELQCSVDPHPSHGNPGTESHIANEFKINEAVNFVSGCVIPLSIMAVGEVILVAAAPVTAGASGAAAVAMYTGVASTAWTCSTSAVRLYNEFHGDHNSNDILDNSQLMSGLNTVADAAGLLSAGHDIASSMRFASSATNVGATRLLTSGRTIPRPMRKAFTAALGKSGRLPSPALHAAAKKHLLNTVNAGVSAYSSYNSKDNVMHKIVVYVAH